MALRVISLFSEKKKDKQISCNKLIRRPIFGLKVKILCHNFFDQIFNPLEYSTTSFSLANLTIATEINPRPVYKL